MSVHRTLEMSVGRDEFVRLLTGAVDQLEVDGETFRCVAGDTRCTMRLVPLTDLLLGTVVVPRYRVELAIDAGEAGAEAFMQRFRRAFLRGGG